VRPSLPRAISALIGGVTGWRTFLVASVSLAYVFFQHLRLWKKSVNLVYRDVWTNSQGRGSPFWYEYIALCGQQSPALEVKQGGGIWETRKAVPEKVKHARRQEQRGESGVQIGSRRDVVSFQRVRQHPYRRRESGCGD